MKYVVTAGNGHRSEHPDFGKSFDWRITTSPSSLAAFRAFANDPYFRARPPIKAKPKH